MPKVRGGSFLKGLARGVGDLSTFTKDMQSRKQQRRKMQLQEERQAMTRAKHPFEMKKLQQEQEDRAAALDPELQAEKLHTKVKEQELAGEIDTTREMRKRLTLERLKKAGERGDRREMLARFRNIRGGIERGDFGLEEANKYILKGGPAPLSFTQAGKEGVRKRLTLESVRKQAPTPQEKAFDAEQEYKKGMRPLWKKHLESQTKQIDTLTSAQKEGRITTLAQKYKEQGLMGGFDDAVGLQLASIWVKGLGTIPPGYLLDERYADLLGEGAVPVTGEELDKIYEGWKKRFGKLMDFSKPETRAAFAAAARKMYRRVE